MWNYLVKFISKALDNNFTLFIYIKIFYFHIKYLLFNRKVSFLCHIYCTYICFLSHIIHISHIYTFHIYRRGTLIEESKLICDSLLNTGILLDNYNNPEYSRTSSTINSHNRSDTFITENNIIYGENKCENVCNWFVHNI